MKTAITLIRSVIFEFFYLGWTILFSLGMLWSFAFPRTWFRPLVVFYYQVITKLENIILGLKYEVKGLENLPKEAPYIVAPKHQSTYETFKLFMLVDNVTIMLKKELMDIPVWGWYTRKLGFISVDRGNAKESLKALNKAINKIKDLKTPLLIFPQGTRVPATANVEEYPYKNGLGMIYKKANIPLVPVALNTGVFWPKNSFLKQSGTITLQILPPIPAGLHPNEMMKQLEAVLEKHSNILVEEGFKQIRSK